MTSVHFNPQVNAQQSCPFECSFSNITATVSALAISIFAYLSYVGTNVVIQSSTVTLNPVIVGLTLCGIVIGLFCAFREENSAPSEEAPIEMQPFGTSKVQIDEEDAANDRSEAAAKAYYRIVEDEILYPQLDKKEEKQKALEVYMQLEIEFLKIHWGKKGVDPSYFETEDFRDKVIFLLSSREVSVVADARVRKAQESGQSFAELSERAIGIRAESVLAERTFANQMRSKIEKV